MPTSEAFTILAVLAARDEASALLDRAAGAYDRLTGALGRTADTAKTTGTVVDESLLQTASGVNALDLASARLVAAQAQSDTATREQAVAEQELLDVQAKMAAGELDAAEAADKQAAALTRLTTAQKQAALAAKGVGDAEKLQADTALAAAGKTDEAAAAQGRFSGLVSKGGAVLSTASKFAVGAGVAVGAIGYESVKAAMNFQTLTTQLVTTAGEAPSALGQVQQGLLQISNQTATSAADLSKSMYIVEAAGFNAAHGGLDVLKASTEGARLENSDFATVSNGVTDILKDYHLGADQASNVTSQLVAAVGHGKANFEQFSAALSNILPMGAAVHLKFSDLSGVLAEMTSHGVTAQRASQNMADALRHLEGPTGTMVKEFKAVGISTDEVQKHLAQQGLGGTLQWLSGIAQNNAKRLGQTYPDALKALMGTASGLNVALLTTGENAGDVNKAIGDIGKATADAQGNVQGFADVQSTLGFKVEQAKQSIQNTGIAIGQALLPMVTRLLGEVNRIVVPITQWAEKHQKLIQLIFAGVGAMVAAAAAIKLVSVAMGILNAVMDANPITLVIIALAGLVAGVIYAYTHFKAFRDVVKDVFDWLKTAVGDVISWVDGHWRLIVSIIGGPIGLAVALITKYWSDIKRYFMDGVHAVESAVSWFGRLPGMFEGWLRAAAAAVSRGVDSVIQFFENLPSRVLGLLRDAGSWLLGIGADVINGLIRGVDGAAGALWDKIKSIGSGVKNFFKSALSIFSPSRVMADEVGKYIPLGIAAGIAANLGPIQDAAKRAANVTVTSARGGIASAGSALPALPALSVAGGSRSGVVEIHNHFEYARIMNEQDMHKFTDLIGRAVATKIGPQAGLRVAM